MTEAEMWGKGWELGKGTIMNAPIRLPPIPAGRFAAPSPVRFPICSGSRAHCRGPTPHNSGVVRGEYVCYDKIIRTLAHVPRRREGHGEWGLGGGWES